HWGIAGAAFATGIGYLAAAAVGFVYFTHYSKTLHFVRPRLGLSALRDLGQTMFNGSSELVTELAIGITTFLFNTVTFLYAGEDGIAAITVILYTEMLMTSILMGFSTGIAPIFSYQFGAKNGRALRRLMRQALKVLALFGLLSFAASQLFGDTIVELFLPQGGHVAEITEQGFILYSFSFLLVGFNLFTSGFFTAISNGPVSALSSFVRNLAAIVVFLLILPHFLGLTGVWLAVPAADFAAVLLNGALLAWAYRHFQEPMPRQRSAQKRRMTMQPCPEN
ncbi:MAG: MATE family efflux transporter, partial [Clostridiales bacterium]|nr:MATE family efflux transporter [Clostridiales bacterium]